MEVIADKSIAAAVEYDSNKVVVAGGVAANSRLRELLEHKGAEKGIEILKPAQILCTDNGAGRSMRRDILAHARFSGLGRGHALFSPVQTVLAALARRHPAGRTDACLGAFYGAPSRAA